MACILPCGEGADNNNFPAGAVAIYSATVKLSILIIIASLTLFASCGRNEQAPDASEASPAANTSQTKPCVNLNTAAERELITLAGVGEVMARKIIEYREQNGPFRRPQDIIIIDGFSEQKYRAISDRICV